RGLSTPDGNQIAGRPPAPERSRGLDAVDRSGNRSSGSRYRGGNPRESGPASRIYLRQPGNHIERDSRREGSGRREASFSRFFLHLPEDLSSADDRRSPTDGGAGRDEPMVRDGEAGGIDRGSSVPCAMGD